ncbi:MAG: glycosyltransferase family 39 protein [Candidatus Latescibacterota bacterium]|jgi:hypothetical protein
MARDEDLPRWVLPACLTAALAARLWGIGHGFPDFVTGDERVLVKETVRFLNAATLEPGHYNYPALYGYLMAGGVWLAWGVGWLTDLGGIGPSVTFAHLFAPGQLALVGRILSTAAGTGLVAVTFALGRRAYGTGAAIGGACFAAWSTVLVTQSRFALPDVTMALFAVAACLVSVQLSRQGGTRTYLAAGVLAGLAISTKYNAGVVVAGLVAAHLLRIHRDGGALLDRRAIAAGVGLLTAFLAGSPYWLIAPGRYWQGILDVTSNLRFSLAPSSWPRLALLASLARIELVWAVLALLGAIHALRRRTAADLVLLAVLLPGFLYLGSWPKGGVHYALYLLPLAGVMAGRWLAEVAAGRWRRWVLPGLVLASLPQAVATVEEGAALRRPDPRSEAARWMEATIPDGTVLGVYRIDYCPPLKGDVHRAFLRERLAASAARPELTRRLQELDRGLRIYTQLSLEYFGEQPVVPPEYAAGIDLSDPKTAETFRRTWMEYPELKTYGVRYLILPSAGYARFLDNEPPPAGTPAHYYYTRNRQYLTGLLDGADPRYRQVRVFSDPGHPQAGRIVLLEVR